MDSLPMDLRYALRQCRKQPGFAAAVVCTLALTIGANTAMFSLVSAVLLRPLPFADPDGLVWIASVRPDNPSAPFSLPEFMDYRDQTRTLVGIAAYANWSASMAGEGVTELVARMAGDVSLDPATVVATTAVLLAVTVVAGWLPARRAARTEPTLALRGE